MSLAHRVLRRLAPRPDPLDLVRRATIELADVGELRKVFGWELGAIIEDEAALAFRYLEDVNDRRRHDAETIGTIVRNTRPATVIDIGTSYGHSAALMAENAPEATIHTVNIPPEDFERGGSLTTIKLSKEDIGRYYRDRGLDNVRQVYANTATWEPDLERIDIAFIDGSHDTEFVINDTRKVVARMGTGSFVLWHDFNPEIMHNYHWIESVCRGVGLLLRDGTLQGRILHVRDSWVGVHRVGGLA